MQHKLWGSLLTPLHKHFGVQTCGTKFESMVKALEHVQTYHSDTMLQPTSHLVFENMENEKNAGETLKSLTNIDNDEPPQLAVFQDINKKCQTSQPVFESMENEEITDINSKKDDIELLEGNNLDNFPIAPIDIKQELLISSVSRHCD